ncbi:hypothetical protein [Rhodococcus zopfii]|uniref:hypothetical protein n=1 Tax=Rhodococcus zopfii TaxID=43772 RepID=UPI00111152D1|nr:hypothetical protein [Rhodococcus zopfii]
MDPRLHPTIDPGEHRSAESRPATTFDRERTSGREVSEDLGAVLRSTPSKLIALGVIVSILLLMSGLVAAQTVSSRKATHDALLATTEPLADAAQNLYSALSVADAAAVTGFISGGIEPEAVRDRYEQAVAEASAQLVAAAGGAGDDQDSSRLLSGISGRLTVYTGLIETARANNRIGNPVGTAYLGEASHLMQTSLLPMAQELHIRGVRAVTDTQHDAVRPPWFAIGLLVAAVAALGGIHLIVSRISRRALNPGLILAIASTGLLLVWLLVAGLVSSTATQRAIRHGAEPLGTVAAGRILAQQSRTAETLLLARRDSTGEYEAVFEQAMARLGDLLRAHPGGDPVIGDAVSRAITARNEWVASHERTHAALSRGDYGAAAVLAIGPGPNGSAAQFAALDLALTEGIETARSELRSNEARASQLLSALAPAAIALTLVSLIGVTIGLWPRLREYR